MKLQQPVLKYMLFGIVLIGLIVAGAACSSLGLSHGNGMVQATWIQPQIIGNTVAISADQVRSDRMVHYNMPVDGGQISFMAYDLDDSIVVRANVCPPCRAAGFSLDGDELVCGTCDTTFDAETGEGISGACANYPKASVSYWMSGNSIVMQGYDMLEAYLDTVDAG